MSGVSKLRSDTLIRTPDRTERMLRHAVNRWHSISPQPCDLSSNLNPACSGSLHKLSRREVQLRSGTSKPSQRHTRGKNEMIK